MMPYGPVTNFGMGGLMMQPTAAEERRDPLWESREYERLRALGVPPAPSSRLPDPPGLAELKALYAAGRITEEQFGEQIIKLYPANPYPNEPPAVPRRKNK
jgi:hypothetical protein